VPVAGLKLTTLFDDVGDVNEENRPQIYWISALLYKDCFIVVGAVTELGAPEIGGMSIPLKFPILKIYLKGVVVGGVVFGKLVALKSAQVIPTFGGIFVPPQVKNFFPIGVSPENIDVITLFLFTAFAIIYNINKHIKLFIIYIN
jgi:hypothetical protein